MSELIERIDFCLKYDELPTVARQTFEQCKAALSQQAELISILESTIQTGLRIDAKVAQQEAEPVAYLWGGVLIRAEESHPIHRTEGAALYRHQPKSRSQSPIAYTWDDNNGFGGSPSPRLAFEYPQYFHGAVTKLYDHPPKPAPLPQPEENLREKFQLAVHCLAVIWDYSVRKGLSAPEFDAAKELLQYGTLQQPVASVPQGLEEFIAAHSQTEYGDDYSLGPYIEPEDLRTWMAGHARVPVEPTQKMIDDGEFASTAFNSVEDIWRMMIAASQEGV